MRQQLGIRTWSATFNNSRECSVEPRVLCFGTISIPPLLLASWSASIGPYCPPDVQTPDLCCSSKRYMSRLAFLSIISRNHSEAPDQQTTQLSSHYPLARTHICSHSFLGLLPIGTTYHLNNVWSLPLTPFGSLWLINSHLRHDTPVVTDVSPLLDIYRSTEVEDNAMPMWQRKYEHY